MANKKSKNFFTRLEMQGFKSFASKTVFEFEGNRSVGVVGPNGSGKSNIIDAIRWALGETGASRLRGNVLKNLIFAGTPKKSASGLAKVTLAFDNSESTLPVDADEVEVTRTIDRSGTSDFYMNNEEVRLKDLVPMFAKAKLGSRGLMIIGQGQSDVIVQSTPKERRRMIEEVLGLKEYRIKKKSAERRLERSRNNIDQITAKIEEIAPHLKFLRKQKSKWDQRSQLENKLQELSKDYFSFHYHKYTSDLKDVDSKLKEFKKKEKSKKKEVSTLEDKMEEIDKSEKAPEKVSKVRKEIKKFERERNDLDRNLARLEAEKKYKSKKEDKNQSKDLPSASYMVETIESFINEVGPAYKDRDSDKIFNALGGWLSKFKNLIPSSEEKPKKKKTNPLDKKISKIKEKLNKVEEKLKKLHEKEDDILLSQEKKNYEFRNHVEKLESKKSELRSIDQNVQNLSLKKERIEYKLEELKNKWDSLGTSSELKNISKPDGESSDKNWNEIEGEIDKLRSRLSSIGDIDHSLIEEAEETEDRYETLVQEKEDMEKAAKDLEKLIKNLDEKIHKDFKKAFSHINREFNNYFRLMFGGGKARLKLSTPNKEEKEDDDMEEEDQELTAGVEIDLNVPKKKITGLDMLSGGEKTLVSIAALFALVSVSPPPFLVLDEIDAALDEVNSKRFADLIDEFSDKTQFIIVTHNRVTMEAVDALYGITMGDDGVSQVFSLKLKEAEEIVGE